MDEVITLPKDKRLWCVVYDHPERAFGQTVFHVLASNEPTFDELIAYVEDHLGEQFDKEYDEFEVSEVFVDCIVVID